jgi:hypothetical protein
MSAWCNNFFSELLYSSGRLPNTQAESCLSDLLISGDFPHFPLLYAIDKIKWGQQPELYWHKSNIRATNRMQIRHTQKQITATFCAELPNTCILFCTNSSISHPHPSVMSATLTSCLLRKLTLVTKPRRGKSELQLSFGTGGKTGLSYQPMVTCGYEELT